MAHAVTGAHLVGSIPLDDERAVFKAVCERLGSHVTRIPDGETGDRKDWVHFQLPIIAGTPGITSVEVPTPPELRVGPEAPESVTLFGIDPTLPEGELKFGNLRYADEAIASYRTFAELQDAGVVPGDVRFQVSLPSAGGVLGFVLPQDRPAVEAAYEPALFGELARIAEHVPPERLAVQWDLPAEVFLVEGWSMLPPWFDGDVWEGVLTRVRRHIAAVPAGIQVGLHVCYGDFKHHRQVDPPDAANLVRLANLLATQGGRQVDWIHLPVPRDRDAEAFCAPLANLDLPDVTKLFLGLVHHTDGVKGTKARIAVAARHVERFGVATECGFGRRSPETVADLLDIHRAVAQPIR